MSFRGVPRDIIELVRQLEDRVRALEQRNATTSQNTVRFNERVIQMEEDDSITSVNVRTKERNVIGKPPVLEFPWSYIGTVAPESNEAGPTWKPATDIEIVGFELTLTSSSATPYTVVLNAHTSTVGALTLDAGQVEKFIAYSHPVSAGQSVWPLVNANASGTGVGLGMVVHYKRVL